jgi:hypothetical protein
MVPPMEAFESFVAVALEARGFVVSSGVKFPVSLQTRKAAYEEIQTHGYEADLVAARSDQLILASVKSFFGSRGVTVKSVTGEAGGASSKRYALLNNPTIRKQVVAKAAKEYGYRIKQIQLRLYVGRFAGPKQGIHEEGIREWAASQNVGAGPIQVIGVKEVVDGVMKVAASRQYIDNPVLVTMKVLEAAGLLVLNLPEVKN